MSFAIFDESFYLSNYPDVKAAVDAGAISSGLQHFQQSGLAEGRVLISPLYNEESYLQTNPDVAAAFTAGSFSSGLQHFIQSGEAEGRSGLTFDEELYLQKYPDVAAAVDAGAISSGLEHFIQFGRAEGRSGDLFFDEKFYLQSYPDVTAAVASGSLSSGLQHFIQFGEDEGRSGTPFNEDVYLELNPDVATAVDAGSFNSGLQHYEQYGQFEEDRIALFSGTTGNDIIAGFGEGSVITGIDLTKAGEGTYNSENSGANQVDTLVGGLGTDLFILGAGRSPLFPQPFYDDGGSADYAVIRNFEPGSDTIQLAGYQSFFYNMQAVDGSLNISVREDGDLIGIVEGVTSLSQLSGATAAGTVQLG